MRIITSVDELNELYGGTSEASVAKVTNALTPLYRADDRRYRPSWRWRRLARRGWIVRRAAIWVVSCACR